MLFSPKKLSNQDEGHWPGSCLQQRRKTTEFLTILHMRSVHSTAFWKEYRLGNQATWFFLALPLTVCHFLGLLFPSSWNKGFAQKHLEGFSSSNSQCFSALSTSDSPSSPALSEANFPFSAHCRVLGRGLLQAAHLRLTGHM